MTATMLPTSTDPTETELTDDDLTLDVRFVTGAPSAVGYDSGECTSDNCSTTSDSAEVTCDVASECSE
ncbi:hypothetical protein [Frankia sp. KB5]|uniref:hypothetical protein n=1 Tax=Frankia sp. KB5 TaxID=683318 RepID=UPI000A10D54E|nr:hypothetical protein [Frankia sp. KB5]ORT46825.1 hypothetical protein KBI5_23085 [Frankia sp. KB5]